MRLRAVGKAPGAQLGARAVPSWAQQSRTWGRAGRRRRRAGRRRPRAPGAGIGRPPRRLGRPPRSAIKRPARPAPAAHTTIEGSGHPGPGPRRARSLARRPPASSRLRAVGRARAPSAAPRNLEPRKFVRRVRGRRGERAAVPSRPAGPLTSGERRRPEPRRGGSWPSPRLASAAMGAAARSLPLAFCLLLLGTLLPRADACNCSPVHPQQAFCNADIGKDGDPAPAGRPPPPRGVRRTSRFRQRPARPHPAEGPSARLPGGLGAF